MEEIIITKNHVKFKASRSGKPGGENRDHRATKVHLWVKVEGLPLEDSEKRIIREKLAHHINHKDELWLENEETRSQETNKEKALEHLQSLITEALKKPAPRFPTKSPRSAEETRIHEKKIIGEKKELRLGENTKGNL